uniref:Elongation of fatty acids protein n=1 Tax=Odontella aurita TaxID=265563 RepID=A0A6U6D1B6_9STRA|mmetsp:Transcript_17402/g.50644  ORF Transcript_17402/g.50644 Transcript_17402/m.50644 type:complete len:312 (+) Transcript_17402:530-1465(+)
MVYRAVSEGSECLTKNAAGLPFESLPCLYPKLGETYTGFELSYNPVPVRDFMVAHPEVPIVACILYLNFILVGRSYMNDKKPRSWRNALAGWNLLLSVFSVCGFARVFPHLVHNWREYGMRDCLCNDPENMYGSGPTGLWVQLFVLSKFPELLDTFFIVIHKKPLILLHWYHHFTVLLYCWHSYVHKAPAGIFFVTMNYAVHGIMYGYYFLMAVKAKPRWMNAKFITIAQISQMVVGVGVTMASFYYYMKEEENDGGDDDPCLIRKENNVAAFVMYGSYLFLFLQFFVGRYLKGKARKSIESKVEANKKAD